MAQVAEDHLGDLGGLEVDLLQRLGGQRDLFQVVLAAGGVGELGAGAVVEGPGGAVLAAECAGAMRLQVAVARPGVVSSASLARHSSASGVDHCAPPLCRSES
jgi:hypothetical protein